MRMLRGRTRVRRAGWVVLAGCAVAAAVAWQAGPGGALGGQPVAVGLAGKPLRLAVVNMREVSDTCLRTQDLRTELEKQREAKVEAVRALREKMDSARKDLEVLKKGSPAWVEQNGKVLRMEVEARVVSELSVKELQAQNLDFTALIYDTILKEIERYAKANGIDVVLRAGEPETEVNTLEDLYRRMALKGVLFAAPTLDITQEVRREVDRAYRSEKP